MTSALHIWARDCISAQRDVLPVGPVHDANDGASANRVSVGYGGNTAGVGAYGVYVFLGEAGEAGALSSIR